jgi:hypothetical protein
MFRVIAILASSSRAIASTNPKPQQHNLCNFKALLNPDQQKRTQCLHNVSKRICEQNATLRAKDLHGKYNAAHGMEAWQTLASRTGENWLAWPVSGKKTRNPADTWIDTRNETPASDPKDPGSRKIWRFLCI